MAPLDQYRFQYIAAYWFALKREESDTLKPGEGGLTSLRAHLCLEAIGTALLTQSLYPGT